MLLLLRHQHSRQYLVLLRDTLCSCEAYGMRPMYKGRKLHLCLIQCRVARGCPGVLVCAGCLSHATILDGLKSDPHLLCTPRDTHQQKAPKDQCSWSGGNGDGRHAGGMEPTSL